jgi:hypothetical protein
VHPTVAEILALLTQTSNAQFVEEQQGAILIAIELGFTLIDLPPVHAQTVIAVMLAHVHSAMETSGLPCEADQQGFVTSEDRLLVFLAEFRKVRDHILAMAAQQNQKGVH